MPCRVLVLLVLSLAAPNAGRAPALLVVRSVTSQKTRSARKKAPPGYRRVAARWM